MMIFGRKKWLRHVGRFVAVSLVACLMISLAACGGKNAPGEGTSGKKGEPADDTPWNHGPFSIMETESGWYTSHANNTMCLRYYEKESGNSILLCNKPECLHEGDEGCEATYRGIRVINAILYDDSIYVYGVQGADGRLGGRMDSPTTETVSLCLWRAALDGSSIDKVATIIEADNTQGQTVNCPKGIYIGPRYVNSFIIHQGYAYLPYSLQFGNGQMGFQGGGIKKVELSTGKIEDVYKMDGPINGVPTNLTAVGDKLYYYRYATNGNRWNPIFCYSITDKTLEPLDLTMAFTMMDGKQFFMLYNAQAAFTKNRIYALAHTYQEDINEDGDLTILSFNAETGELLEEECVVTELSYVVRKETLSSRHGSYYQIMPSPDGLLISDGEGAYFYDFSGKKLGEITFPKEMLGIGDRDKSVIMDYLISDGKLYLNVGIPNTAFYKVLYVPIEDVYQGKGEWKDAYQIQGTITYQQFEDIMNSGGILINEE